MDLAHEADHVAPDQFHHPPVVPVGMNLGPKLGGDLGAPGEVIR